MEVLDNIDRMIISSLIDDSDMMSKTRSKKLKIHPNTLLQRSKKLKKHGVILKYQAVVDFNKVDKMMEVMMFLRVNMEKEWESALKQAAKFPEIVSFILVSGEHDALAIARVRDERHLADLMRRMQATKVVTKTTTHIIVDYYRRPYEYNPIKAAMKR